MRTTIIPDGFNKPFAVLVTFFSDQHPAPAEIAPEWWTPASHIPQSGITKDNIGRQLLLGGDGCSQQLDRLK
jgi:hypothetical protein